MSDKKFIVSLSPHAKSNNSVKGLMYSVILAMLPALILSMYFFGIDAIRVTLTAVVACVGFEWLIAKYLLKQESTILDGSAVITGMLLAFNIPSNIPCWIIIAGSLVAIGMAKMSFGGLGNNPFNPALVGRVFMLISFPVQMTSWPKINVLNFAGTDAVTGPTPLAIVKEGLSKGQSFSDIMASPEMPYSYADMFYGSINGSMGEISALAIILGGLFLLVKKVIHWQIPVSIILTITIFTGLLYLTNSNAYAPPVFHLLTGGVMLGAIFMATDYSTSPMNTRGMWIFGIGIGVLTVIIRVFGAYPEGISFAILIMNAFVPLLNNIKPKRFGEVKNG